MSKYFCHLLYFPDILGFFLNRLPKGAKIIDVGCGPGHIAEHCETLTHEHKKLTGLRESFSEQKGFEVFGIDLSEGMLKIAKARCKAASFEKKGR